MFSSGRDPYFNQRCIELARERDELIKKYDREINEEYQREKDKYKFDWKRFMVLVSIIIWLPIGIRINHLIFPKDSIWSWYRYEKWIGKL